MQQLRSFLGLLNYYSKFVRNLASVIHPLNQLLQHNVRWKWSAECVNAFTSGTSFIEFAGPLRVSHDHQDTHAR